VASIPADATGSDLEVFLPGRINASYILQACNSIGCSDSSEVFVTGTLAEAVGYVKASNTDLSDFFGFSVVLSRDGNTLAVGAINERSRSTGIGGDEANDTSVSFSGAVYVFVRSGGAWSQQAYIKASNTGRDDNFGSSVALSDDGNTLAVGASGEDSKATGIDGDQSNNDATDSGAVYVFTRSGVNWSQQAYVKASNPDEGDLFGLSVALAGDGDTLAVGVALEDSNASGIGGDASDNSASRSGAAYVFSRIGDAWSEEAYLKASNAGEGDRFGISVALARDGNTLAVGANGEESSATGIGGDQSDNSAGEFTGAAYVFTRSGGTWSQQEYIKASNTSPGDQFGFSVALAGDGNTLAVGAANEDSSAFGIGGDQANNNARDSGAVYVFTRAATNWLQEAYIKASNTGPGDSFGSSLGLNDDGSTLVVGAESEASDAIGIGGDQGDGTGFSGAVYVFDRSGISWSQSAYIKSSNTEFLDGFGESVTLAGDGSTLAVGATREDSAATGIGGDQSNNDATSSGAVYLY
jgi:hypothetical protein